VARAARGYDQAVVSPPDDPSSLARLLIEAADEERRRIGRNLHDGVQQRLVVLGHRIALAQRKLETAPGEAAEHLRHAAEESRAAGEELRELARGLHPAGLTEYGLQPALAALAQRSPLEVRVLALPDRRLPELVEVSIYYLVSEALSNSVKYAEASHVRVHVAHRADTIVAEVADDGVGGAAAAAGSGLRGLESRMEALGGRLAVASPPGGGTRLRATIPVRPWRTAREPFLEFGHEGDGGDGERQIELVRAGEKTMGVSLAREWELEGGLPGIGKRLPVFDHRGRRHATVEVVRVAVMPFEEIGEDVARAHLPGIESIAAWRERQRGRFEGARQELAALFDEPDWRFSEDQAMVVVSFRLHEEDEEEGSEAA
jgi:uncharacterized protein YhfF/two-component sensor histidine kinase